MYISEAAFSFEATFFKTRFFHTSVDSLKRSQVALSENRIPPNFANNSVDLPMDINIITALLARRANYRACCMCPVVLSVALRHCSAFQTGKKIIDCCRLSNSHTSSLAVTIHRDGWGVSQGTPKDHNTRPVRSPRAPPSTR